MFEVQAAHAVAPFAWGVNDCCLYVARTLDAMTGSDLESRILAEYHDEASARALIARHGSLAAAVTHFLGEPQDVRATRGDVVEIDHDGDPAVGICFGADVYAMGPGGLQKIGRECIRRVWVTPHG